MRRDPLLDQWVLAAIMDRRAAAAVRVGGTTGSLGQVGVHFLPVPSQFLELGRNVQRDEMDPVHRGRSEMVVID